MNEEKNKQASFVEHLAELRSRLVKSVIYLFIFFFTWGTVWRMLILEVIMLTDILTLIKTRIYITTNVLYPELLVQNISCSFGSKNLEFNTRGF